MGDHQSGDEEDAPPRLRLHRHPVQWLGRWIRDWRLWHELSPRVWRTVLVIDVLALLLSGYVATLHSVADEDLWRFAILVGAAAIHIEATRAIERQREHAAGAGPHLDMMTAWSFAGLLLLPPVLALAMVIFTQAYGWLRTWKNGPVKIYRRAFSGAVLLLATDVAVLVLESASFYPGLPGPALGHWILVAVAAAIRWAINYYLIIQVIGLSGPDVTAEELFDKFGDQFLDASATGMAIFTAIVLVHYPAAVPIALVILVGFHRTVLTSQFQKAARTDSKTGLLNAEYFKSVSTAIITREAQRQNRVGILFVDIDHFKQVNDTNGHAVGDAVLKAVATLISGEVRSDFDQACRFGGEEFTVLIPDVTPESLAATAERIRRRVEVAPIVVKAGVGFVDIRLTVSVGGALYPDDGQDYNFVLKEADDALYRAKERGRNQCYYANGLAKALKWVAPPQRDAANGERSHVNQHEQSGLTAWS